MGFLLKASIVSIYFVIGGLIIAYPNSAQEYISGQYTNFREILSNFVAPTYLPEDFVATLPLPVFYAFGAFTLLGGLLIILNCSNGILAYSYIAFLLAVVLSMPKEGTMIKSCRRLGMIFILFFASIILFVEIDDNNLQEIRRKKMAKAKESSPRSKTKKEK
eukprot:TRINITY_DN13080_c0_g1_i3.p1 TRINITY_DN13080_c0_g1~~TRINITY_DN13080_c0_g1_i3.p1  ORF type:complete len:162 (-),score=44.83 TRINITY_DN13080_c0_g1_i3:148-633(-)